MLRLRENPTIRSGSYESVVVGSDDNILVYKREIKGSTNDRFYIALNVGSTTTTVDLASVYSDVSTEVEVVVASLQSNLVPG